MSFSSKTRDKNFVVFFNPMYSALSLFLLTLVLVLHTDHCDREQENRDGGARTTDAEEVMKRTLAWILEGVPQAKANKGESDATNLGHEVQDHLCSCHLVPATNIEPEGQ